MTRRSRNHNRRLYTTLRLVEEHAACELPSRVIRTVHCALIQEISNNDVALTALGASTKLLYIGPG